MLSLWIMLMQKLMSSSEFVNCKIILYNFNILIHLMIYKIYLYFMFVKIKIYNYFKIQYGVRSINFNYIRSMTYKKMLAQSFDKINM